MKSIITKYKPSFISTLKCSVPLTTRRSIQIPSNPTFRVIHSSEMAFFTRRLVLVSRSLPLQIRWILVRKCSNQPAMPVLTSPFQADPIKLKVSLLFNLKLSNFIRYKTLHCQFQAIYLFFPTTAPVLRRVFHSFIIPLFSPIPFLHFSRQQWDVYFWLVHYGIPASQIFQVK